MRDKASHMAYRFIARERFRESSIAGGLAVSLGSGGAPLYEAGSVTAPGTDGLTLDVTGDSRKGYSVALLFNGKPILRHNQGGEFSAAFQNKESSLEEASELSQ
jgi:hypothetical protein